MTTSPKPASNAPTSSRGGGNATKTRTVTSDISPKTTQSSAPNTSAALALSMGWQLLVVSVVPLVAGHLLDAHFGTAPVWLVVGGVITLAGTITVVIQTVRQLGVINGTPSDAAADARAEAAQNTAGKLTKTEDKR
jgi:F0F1-type ATP synthase assembly protein I